MLADSAEVADGKLFMLGGGWTFHLIGAPMALVIKVDVPWVEANKPHLLKVELFDADGNTVVLPGPVGPAPVQFEGKFEVGRPPGVTPGTDLSMPIAMNLGPMPLVPEKRYEWRISINGESKDEWHLSFSTGMPPQPGSFR